jgi:hypothetical protein
MPKYRKKPVVIEALEWNGSNAVEVIQFTDGQAKQEGQIIIIPTLEGDHEASLGDMIIKGVSGEFYPCKPDIFEMTYEQSDSQAVSIPISTLQWWRDLVDLNPADLAPRIERALDDNL